MRSTRISAASAAGTSPAATASCAQPAPNAPLPEKCGIRLVQWNIHIGIDMTSRRNLKAQADVLNRLDADVIVLNEVDKNCRRTGYTDMTKQLALLTGNMFSLFGAARILPPEGLYGNAALSRFPTELVGSWLLPAALDETRGMTLAKIAAGVPFYLAFTHLSFRDTPEENAIRVAAARRLDELISENCVEDLPVILAGDFNCVPASNPLKVLEDAGWALGKPLPTFPSAKPVRAIDHIFLRNGRTKLRDRFTVDEKIASDHVPVVNELVIFRNASQKQEDRA